MSTVTVIKGGSDAFKKFLSDAGGKLVVVDFYADWCGPCKMIAPKVEALAAETPNVLFCKVNVDNEEDVAAECGISAMPTFQFYKEGKKLHEFSGASEEKLKKAVETYK